MEKYSNEMLGTITRGQIIVESLPERAVTRAKNMLDIFDQIDRMTPLEERQKFAAANNPTLPKARTTYTVSYVGNITWGAIAEYIDSIYTVSMGHLMLEMNAVGEKIFITFQQCLRSDKYIQGFLREAEKMNIPYEIQGPFAKNLPKLEI